MLSTSFFLSVALIGAVILVGELFEGNLLRRLFPHNADYLLTSPSLLGPEYINSGIVLSFLFWPALTEQLCQKKYGMCFVLVVLIGLVLRHVNSDAAMLSLILGSCVFLISYIGKSYFIKFFSLISFFLILTVPLGGAALSIPQIAKRIERFVPEHRARLIIWEYTCRMIRKKPFKGWGLGTATPAAQKIAMPDMHGALPTSEEAPLSFSDGKNPFDPHNGFLHIWVELGAFGALLSALVIGWIPFLWAHRFPGVFVPAFHGFYTAVWVVLGVNCSLWHTWLLCAAGIAGLGMICVAQRFSFKAYMDHDAKTERG